MFGALAIHISCHEMESQAGQVTQERTEASRKTSASMVSDAWSSTHKGRYSYVRQRSINCRPWMEQGQLYAQVAQVQSGTGGRGRAPAAGL